MHSIIAEAGEILEHSVDGFHRYCLTEPMRPDYVSGNLCTMLGCTAQELLCPEHDGYAQMVHLEDRERYQAFLQAMAAKEQRMTLQYRMVHASGQVLYVQDTMVSRRNDKGTMQGYSTLTDVTQIKRENEALHALNATVPCGILKYTCEESPCVTYINEQMLRILRCPTGAPEQDDQLAQYKRNIYLLVPPESRRSFKRFLNQVYATDRPIAGEMTVMRFDGTRVRLYGWISKCVNSQGEEEFQSVCMDVTERYNRKRREEEQSYLHALSQVYDEICEIDLAGKTVRFLQGRYFDKLGPMAKMPLLLEDTAREWIENVVVEEDRESVREAFMSLIASGTAEIGDYPPQMEFRVRLSDGTVRYYLSVFLKMNGARCLLCCRNVSQQKEIAALKLENSALRDMANQIRGLVDGMLAFEIRGDCVRPMYISRNVCSFFGIAEDDWLNSMQSLTPIRDFVSRCHIPYETFLELLENREAEFHYTDVATGTVRRIKAICTAGTDEPERRCFVMLYDITAGMKFEATSNADKQEMPSVQIRTFGYFDVFVDGTPIAFRNEKAKELLALLVDRRGGFVTSGEAISLLWEDEPANAVTLARYRKVALRLKNTLEEYGIADIVESVDGKRRIVQKLIRCDLYDYLSGEAQYAQLFKGNYLQNYSWGEVTLAELSD